MLRRNALDLYISDSQVFWLPILDIRFARNLLVPTTLLYAKFLTMTEQTMTDQDFRNRSDSALETLRKRLQQLGDEYNFEVE